MTIPAHRLNCPDVCFVCARRAAGGGVGRPGRIGWLCTDCSPKIGRIAMATKFDIYEERACKAVAEQLPATNFTFPADELPDFVRWIVEEFGEAIRRELESGEPPF